MPGETQFEAMAADLNPRGLPYRLDDREFPPGVWVEVNAKQARALQFAAWAQLREKANG